MRLFGGNDGRMSILHPKAVVGGLEVEGEGGELFREVGVAGEHVREVCQVALFGADAAADFDGFLQGVVGDVLAALDGVEDEDFQAL